MQPRKLFALAVAAVLAACAGPGPREREAEAFERYMDFAGAPIDEFTYLGRVDGWRSLGRNVVAVRTSGNDAYVLKVAEPCSDLEFAQRIALTATGHTVRKGFDSVRVGRQSCTITEIRPVDYGAMRSAERGEQ